MSIIKQIVREKVPNLYKFLKKIKVLFIAPYSTNIRNAVRYYITGNGIEIGALHNPLKISDLAINNIKYVDRLSSDDLRKQYPELKNLDLVHVDIVDNGEKLEKIEDGSLNFIIANHLIEHTRNPIGTIQNWLSKLKPGGIVFMAVPNKLHTFDRDRQLTSLAHLISDYTHSPEERLTDDRQHFIEWVTLVNKVPDKEVNTHVKHLLEIDYSIHFHTYTMQSFLELLIYIKNELKFPFTIKACVDNSEEFLIVIMRENLPTGTESPRSKRQSAGSERG